MNSTRRHPPTDYYAVLGLQKNASQQVIKQAYHDLARKYHPDANAGNPKAESRFKEINEAYSVLSDPDKRQQYDARMGRPVSTGPRRDYRARRSPPAYQPRVAPGTASARFGSSMGVRAPRQESTQGHGVAANLNLSVAGLSLGLRIVDSLISRLDRAASTPNRTPPPRRSPPGPQGGTDKRG